MAQMDARNEIQTESQGSFEAVYEQQLKSAKGGSMWEGDW